MQCPLEPQPDPAGSRRGRRRVVECGARGRGAHAGPWRGHRSRRHPERRARHVAHGAVVQRVAGALRARDRCGEARRFRGDREARALPLRRDRRDRRHRRAGAGGPQERHAAGGHAAGRVVRQGAEDAARCAARDAAAGAAGACGHRPARRGVPAAAISRGGRQDLPDLDWRSHRRRHDQPRPDGGALAGAGGRRRRHASPTTSATRARPWPWASARRWRCSTRRPPAGWRSPRR